MFVDPAGEAPLTALYEELTGETRPFAELAYEAKLEQATTTFQHEVARLDRICSVPDVERLLSSLPVYRTYDGGRSEEDREVLREAGLEDLYDGKPDAWVTRFQQTTPPVMAKGVEDTAFYRYVRLLALNDVGGDPARFGITVAQFHEANRIRAERFPHNLLVTQTHDTKRSGDVRARIGALAGMAAAWAEEVRAWFALTEELRADGAPDAVERLLIFQTLVGAWPLSAERLEAYLEKALREAKRNTTWVEQDTDYEGRVQRFAVACLSHEPFLERFEPFAARVAEAGHRSALAQLALKLTVPGVPDIYQGDELVSLSLVDPDNRREVDWDGRRTLLATMKGSDPFMKGSDPFISAQQSPDEEKLALIVETLALRRERPDAFAGSYEPLEAGPDACAFVRGGEVLVVVVVRDAGQDAEIDVPWGGRTAVRDLTGGRSYAIVAR